MLAGRSQGGAKAQPEGRRHPPVTLVTLKVLCRLTELHAGAVRRHTGGAAHHSSRADSRPPPRHRLLKRCPGRHTGRRRRRRQPHTAMSSTWPPSGSCTPAGSGPRSTTPGCSCRRTTCRAGSCTPPGRRSPRAGARRSPVAPPRYQSAAQRRTAPRGRGPAPSCTLLCAKTTPCCVSSRRSSSPCGAWPTPRRPAGSLELLFPQSLASLPHFSHPLRPPSPDVGFLRCPLSSAAARRHGTARPGPPPKAGSRPRPRPPPSSHLCEHGRSRCNLRLGRQRAHCGEADRTPAVAVVALLECAGGRREDGRDAACGGGHTHHLSPDTHASFTQKQVYH